MTECVLCIDIGTTSLKAALIGSTGEVVSFCTRRFLFPHRRFIANSWFKAFGKIIRKMMKEGSGENTQNPAHVNARNFSIKALSVSGNGPTVVTENGFTVRWNERYPVSKERTGTSLFMPKIIELKEKFPLQYKKSKYIFSGPEFFVWKLTGNAVTILPEERFIPAYWEKAMLEREDIPQDKLPPFYKPGKSYGIVKKEIFSELGLSAASEADINVYGAGPDFVAALIGTNTLESGKLCDRSGSSEGYNFCIPRFISYQGLRTLPSVVPGLWNISALIPDSSKLSKKKRLLKICEAVGQLRNMAENNQLEFPSIFSSTGGQTRNKKWMKEKAACLKTKLTVCTKADSELLGDAAVAWYGLGKYKSLLEAASNIYKEDMVYESL